MYLFECEPDQETADTYPCHQRLGINPLDQASNYTVKMMTIRRPFGSGGSSSDHG